PQRTYSISPSSVRASGAIIIVPPVNLLLLKVKNRQRRRSNSSCSFTRTGNGRRFSRAKLRKIEARYPACPNAEIPASGFAPIHHSKSRTPLSSYSKRLPGNRETTHSRFRRKSHPRPPQETCETRADRHREQFQWRLRQPRSRRSQWQCRRIATVQPPRPPTRGTVRPPPPD